MCGFQNNDKCIEFLASVCLCVCVSLARMRRCSSGESMSASWETKRESDLPMSESFYSTFERLL